ncbi:bifunctional metallophosphatase/5'-nucleotidase [Proteiniphilum sp. UBA5384]|uniref:bifunctional metallophosphatase/5'-nucleotidase n=1 Tax=Proteiniphilum sp. UBA5384 TaxID=1947279 RepID=UPI0025FCD449|nr:metallophosphoesterase [Proteiniphilum sp. UBA5384]
MHSTNNIIILCLALLFSSPVFSQKRIVILHTNDTHSRIEPLPKTDKTAPGKGGVERRASFINEVRRENRNVLLLDAGDFVQGTPYFNLFKGEVEVKAMNLMKYDAATLGNHEFDYGLEVLEEIIRKADFPVITSNYDFSQTGLANLVKPYVILKKDGVRIGIIGICVKPQGLIAAENYKGMKFLDPVKTANKLAGQLRSQQNCDMVICLSHLGYQQDQKLAESTRHIDLIIGGHSHTYMKEPEIRKNLDNKDVMIYQTNGRGRYVGKIDVELEKTER